MEEVIDLKKLIIYFWKKRKIIVFSILGIFFFFNIVFFAFKGFMYTSIGTIETPTDSTVEKIASYTDFLKSDYIIDNAIINSNIAANGFYVKRNLSLYNNLGSRIYTISLQYNNKEIGHKLCGAIVSELAKKIESFEGDKVFIHNVVTDVAPTNFNIIKNELTYVILGSIMTFGFMFTLFFFNTKIKSKNELNKKDIIGIIGNDTNLSLIKTKIKLNISEGVLLFSTTHDVDCKNEILDLVKEFAKDSKVLFVNANIRNKSKYLGYSDLLNNEKVSIFKYIKHKSGYDILECGTNNRNVETKLSSKNNIKILNDLRKKYDYIILFNSNVLDYGDSMILSKISDYNYFVVGINKTNKRDFDSALEMYKQVNSVVNGVIVIDKDYEIKLFDDLIQRNV